MRKSRRLSSRLSSSWTVLLSFRASLLVELAFSVLTVFAVTVISVVAEDFFDKRLMNSWAASVLVAVMLCLLSLATMVSWLIRKLVEIEGKIGLSVRYVESEGSRSALFRELRRIAMQAKERIIIVNSWPLHVTERDDDPEVAAERSAYLDTLIDKVRNDMIFYHRVIQAPEGDLRLELGEKRLSHFYSMLDEKDRHPDRVWLTRAIERRPLTFTLVDSRWLMLEVDQKDSKGMHMTGVLIFDDPGQMIIRDFDRFYRFIALGSKGSIERHDLPPLVNTVL